jgi:hypothetical protein
LTRPTDCALQVCFCASLGLFLIPWGRAAGHGQAAGVHGAHGRRGAAQRGAPHHRVQARGRRQGSLFACVFASLFSFRLLFARLLLLLFLALLFFAPSTFSVHICLHLSFIMLWFSLGSLFLLWRLADAADGAGGPAVPARGAAGGREQAAQGMYFNFSFSFEFSLICDYFTRCTCSSSPTWWWWPRSPSPRCARYVFSWLFSFGAL